MAMELVDSTANGTGSDKDTLYMLGGLAMVVFGAGLILSNPFVRRCAQQAAGSEPRGVSAGMIPMDYDSNSKGAPRCA